MQPARVLDVGCGYAKGVHDKRGSIGVDLNRGLCDIVADATHLPFQAKTFDRILLYAVLEHLDNPFPCLKQCLYVARDKAKFEILIPVDARSWMVLLKMFVTAFPWGFLRAFKVWWRWSVRFRGVAKFKRAAHQHKNCIQPHHIAQFIRLTKIEVLGMEHYWFSGRKGQIVSRIIENPPHLGVERSWYIEGEKKEGKIALSE